MNPDDHPLLDASVAFEPDPAAAAGSPDELVPAIRAPLPASLAPAPPAGAVLSPLNLLREQLQPIAHNLLCDVAYWEQIKRTSSPRTFLEFVRFAFAADLEGKPGSGNNQQVIIQAPFPRGPLDVLPPHLRME